jgi:UDP-N-acetylmuramoyl-L-alanyl-D-glutamate--2,6-diaminopimelate ligase
MAAYQQATAITLAELLPAEVFCVLDAEQIATLPVGPLVLDSRRVAAGDVFVAVPGFAVDGRQFIDKAIEAGAVLVLAHSNTEECAVSRCGDVIRVDVPNLAGSLSEVAGRYYAQPTRDLFAVGITGTNGKTSCSFWLSHLLNLLGADAAMVGTLGYGRIKGAITDTGMTTPDAISTQAMLAECRQQGADSVVMEVSSHSLDQGRVSDVAFDVAVFTNLSRDHLDYHGSEQAYRDAKLKLMAMPGLSKAIINLDDAESDRFIAVAKQQSSVWTYSLSNSSADFYCENICYLPHGVTAQLHFPQGMFTLEAPIIGEFNLSNLLAVIAVAMAKGLEPARILNAVKQLPGVPGRMQSVELDSGTVDDLTVLVDYAHTPDALQSVLAAVRHHCQGKLWCVFGCGGDRDQGKRPQMGRVAADLADRVVVTSDNPRTEAPDDIINQVTAGITKQDHLDVISDRAEAIAFAITHAANDDCVLLAGKGHENYQQIGVEKLPFDDAVQARIALQQRMGGAI